jgi:hypothetical protein
VHDNEGSITREKNHAHKAEENERERIYIDLDLITPPVNKYKNTRGR